MKSCAAQASREAPVKLGEPDDVSSKPAGSCAAPTMRKIVTDLGEPDAHGEVTDGEPEAPSRLINRVISIS